MSGMRRAPVACTYCRQRKRRCDGRTPQCKTCRIKGLDCVYTEPVLQRDDDHSSDRLEAIESLLKEHTDALAALRRNSNSSHFSPPQRTDHVLPGQDRELSAPGSSSFPFSFWAFNQAGVGLSPQPHRTEETPPLTIPLGHQTCTSNLLVLPQLRNLIGEYPEEFFFRIEDSRSRSAAAQSILSPLGQYVAEDSPIANRVDSDVYFDQFMNLVYPFHPFLDQEDIIALYDGVMSRGLDRDNQSGLLLAILALGATAGDAVDRKLINHSGDTFIQQALKILSATWTLSFSGDIVVAQGLVLCALYFTYTVEPLMAWRLIHMASTSIQQILARSNDLFQSEIGITRLSWVCFIIESDILAEFHQPRSGIELLVDRMPFPNYGTTPGAENLYTLAEISARSLLNRIHHTLFFTDSLSIYTGRNLSSSSSTSLLSINPDASLLRLCQELDRQLESWYESLPEDIKPDLAGNPPGSRQASLLRLRYWSAKHIIYRPFVIYVSSLTADQRNDIPQYVIDMCEICLSACRTYLLTAGYLTSYRTPYTYSTAQFAFSCAIVTSMAAQSPPLQGFVEDIGTLQQRAMEVLEPWAQPKTSIKCAFDIVSSIATKQMFQS